MYLINELNCTDGEFKDKFRIVWNQIKLMNPFLEAEESPEGFVLGGQPQEKQRSQICFPQG